MADAIIEGNQFSADFKQLQLIQSKKIVEVVERW